MMTILDHLPTLAGFFRDDPAGQAIAAQALAAAATKQHKVRKATADEIARLTTAELEAQRAHAAELAPLERREQTLAAQLATAREQVERSRHTHAVTVNALDQRRSRLRYELYESRPLALLKSFAETVRTLEMQTFALRDSVSDRAYDGRLYVAWTNEPGIEARCEALSAISRLLRDEWPYLADTDAELTARFDRLVADLPDVPTKPERYRGRSANADNHRRVHNS